MIYIIALLSLAASFLIGYHVADGEAAKRELHASIIAEDKYHAQELAYNEVAARLEELQTSRAAQAGSIMRKSAEIRSRTLYARDCLDLDGLRLVNDALLGQSPTVPKPAPKVPSIDPP